MRSSPLGSLSRAPERDSESMSWKPTLAQLEIIEQYGNAHMPVEAIAAALDVHPDDLRAWIGRLVQTRSQSRYAPPPMPPPPAPVFKGP